MPALHRFLRCVCAAGALAAATGCAALADRALDSSLGIRLPLGLRIDHIRDGTPFSVEAFGGLEPGESDLGQALAAMGAPQRVRRTPTEEILEYYYAFGRRTRLVVRPFFLFSYANALDFTARGLEDGLDVILLTFDHAGTLRRKEFRKATPEPGAGATVKSVLLQ